MEVELVMKHCTKQLQHQGGIASLEFLFAAPLLILVMMAVSELGWAFHQYQVMTRASRDGARFLSSNALVGSVGMIYLEAGVVQQARNLVVFGNVNGTGQPVLPGWSASDITVTSPDAEHVSVSARYGYVPMMGNIPAFYGGQPMNLTFEMRSTVQMRAL